MGIFDRWKKKKEKEEARTDIDDMEEKKDDYKGSVEAFKRCPTCGAELPAGATECTECGEKLEYSVEDSKIVDKPDIDKMWKEKDYKGLVRALSHLDPEVRRRAAEALGRIARGGEARAVVAAGAVPKLVECLDDVDWIVRVYAADALGVIAEGGEASVVVSAGAVPKLVKCLGDAHENVRWMAAWTLAGIALRGEARAVVPKLVKCLDDAHENVRGDAALALGRIALGGEARAVVEAGAVPKLVERLDDAHENVRGNAALALGSIAAKGEARAVVDAGAVPKLVKCLDDAHEYVRGNAADALGRIALGGEARAVVEAGAVPKLVKCLDDADKGVRRNAAWALAWIAAKGEARAVVEAGAVPKLVKCLDDAHEDVRRHAADALGSIAAKGEARAVVEAGAVPKLVGCLNDADENVRGYAAFALACIAAKGEARAVVSAGAVPKLVECLGDADEEVRGYAAEALGAIFRGFTESVEKELARFRSMGINTDEEERLVRELKESTERVDWKKCAELVKKITSLVAKHTEKLIVNQRERASEFENELARLRASGIDTQKGESSLNALKESIERKDLRKCEELVKEITGLVAQYNQELKRQIESLREQANKFENELARLRACGIDTRKGENLLNALKESIDQKDLRKCEELVKEITELVAQYNQELKRQIESLREQANKFENELARLRACGIDTQKGESSLNALKESIERKDLRKCEELVKEITGLVAQYNQELKRQIESLREQANKFENELARLRACGIDTQKGESSLNALKESIEREDLRKCEELVKEITELLSEYQSELERRITSLREQANRFANDLERLRASGIDLSRADAMLAELRASIEQTNLRKAEEVAKALRAELERLKDMVNPEIKVEFQNLRGVGANRWGRATFCVSNQGNDDAIDIVCEISGKIEVYGALPKIDLLKKNERKEIEIRINAQGEGDVPVEVKVKCKRRLDGKAYETVLNPELYIGEVLSTDPLRAIRKHYTDMEEVGRGRMGIVYRAVRKDTGEVVALKHYIFPIEERQIEKEIFIWRNLEHPHIVKIKNVYLTVPAIEMEYLGGGNLADYIRNEKSISQKKLGAIFYQVVDALCYAYYKRNKGLLSRSIINTDLKPEHILFDAGKEQIKITDWGLCKVAGSLSDSSGLTMHWAAPEQFSSRIITGYTMSYLVGAIMYYAFSHGVEPYPGRYSREQIMYMKLQNEKPSMDVLRKQKVPEELIQLIDRCLEQDYANRPTLIEIGEALNRIFELGEPVQRLRAYMAEYKSEKEFILESITSQISEAEEISIKESRDYREEVEGLTRRFKVDETHYKYLMITMFEKVMVFVMKGLDSAEEDALENLINEFENFSNAFKSEIEGNIELKRKYDKINEQFRTGKEIYANPYNRNCPIISDIRNMVKAFIEQLKGELK